MVDNTIALQVKPLDIATPLMQAAKMRQMESEQQQQQEAHNREAVASEMRGLAPYADSPEFAGRWAQSIDTLAQAGKIRPDIAANIRNSPSQLQLRSILAQSEDPRLSFQKQQAEREQANTDRSFKEGVRQFDVGQETKNLAPGFARTPGGAQAFVPGGPADPRYIADTKGEKALPELIAERERAIIGRNQDPNEPHNRAYLLTGRFPKEDQMPMTATEKKAIMEADEHVLAHDQTIDLLKEAKTLSPKAMGFKGAGYLGTVGAPFNQTAADTAQLDTLVTTKAVGELKAIFGGNPTEGERAILLDIAGSSKLPDSERQKIYNRAMRLVERRREFAQQKVDELRGGTYFKTGGGQSKNTQSAPVTKSTTGMTIDPRAIERLKKNPKEAEMFDETFGVGSAARVLGVIK